MNDNRNPYLFIVAGPTGSGKSSLTDKIKKYLGLKDEKTAEVVIDNLVEKNPGYKKAVIDIIEKNCHDVALCDKLKRKINELDQGLLNEFKKAYFAGRRSQDCKTGEDLKMVKGPRGPVPIEEQKDRSCSAMNNAILAEGLRNSYDIIFETTGMGWPVWLFRDNKKALTNNNYSIVMAWSLTSIKELIKRNQGRALVDMIKFIKATKKNEISSAPRLPDVSTKTYTDGVQTIQDTFYNIIQLCVNKEITPEECGGNVRFLVFDNTTRKGPKESILYDSDIPLLRSQAKKIKELLNIDGTLDNPPLGHWILGGGKSKRRRRRRRRKNKRTRKKRRKRKR